MEATINKMRKQNTILLSPFRLDGSPKTFDELNEEKLISDFDTMKKAIPKEKMDSELNNNTKMFVNAIKEIKRFAQTTPKQRHKNQTHSRTSSYNKSCSSKNSSKEESTSSEDTDDETLKEIQNNTSILAISSDKNKIKLNQEPNTDLSDSEDIETTSIENISKSKNNIPQEETDKIYSKYLQHQQTILNSIYNNKNINVKDKNKYHTEISSMLEIFIEQVKKISSLEQQLKETQKINIIHNEMTKHPLQENITKQNQTTAIKDKNQPKIKKIPYNNN